MKPVPTSANADQRLQIYTNQIATLADLRDLKIELLDDIRKLFREYNGQVGKKWLKTSDLQKLLGASPGTLQRLRNAGTLPHKKIGGIVYYDYDELEKLLKSDSNSLTENKRPRL